MNTPIRGHTITEGSLLSLSLSTHLPVDGQHRIVLSEHFVQLLVVVLVVELILFVRILLKILRQIQWNWFNVTGGRARPPGGQTSAYQYCNRKRETISGYAHEWTAYQTKANQLTISGPRPRTQTLSVKALRAVGCGAGSCGHVTQIELQILVTLVFSVRYEHSIRL